jgi:hypothetical protein
VKIITTDYTKIKSYQMKLSGLITNTAIQKDIIFTVNIIDSCNSVQITKVDITTPYFYDIYPGTASKSIFKMRVILF